MFESEASSHKAKLVVILEGLNPVGLDAILVKKTEIKEVRFYTDGSQGDFLGDPISRPNTLLVAEPGLLSKAHYTELFLRFHNPSFLHQMLLC